MSKTIGFTYDLKCEHELKIGEPEDMYAELDREDLVAEVEESLKGGGHRVVRIGNAKKLLSRIQDLDVDIILNICEGIGSRNRESEVPTILELYNIPYVGSDGLTLSLTLDKAMAKRVFMSAGVPTPKFFVADEKTDFENLDSMRFPFIVKPRNEGSSKGISESSIVADREALKVRARAIMRAYSQPALVEEFVSGGEFTVLVIGNEAPQALPPVQVEIAGNLVAGDLIYTSRRVNNTEINYVCPPKISNELQKSLCDIALKAYRVTDCRDFARVDFRVDLKGRPFVLEVNPLPSLSSEDVFLPIAQAMGLTYAGLILKIVAIALQRYDLG